MPKQQPAVLLDRRRIALGASLLFWSMLFLAIAGLVQWGFYQFVARTVTAPVHYAVAYSTLSVKSLAVIGSCIGVCLLTSQQSSRLSTALAWIMRAAVFALVISTFNPWMFYIFGLQLRGAPVRRIEVFALVALLSALIVHCGRHWREILPEKFVTTVQIFGLVLLFALTFVVTAFAWRGMGPDFWVRLPHHAIADLTQALMLLAGAAIAFRISRVAGRMSKGRCPVCLYDLQRNLQSGCPECGWLRADAAP